MRAPALDTIDGKAKLLLARLGAFALRASHAGTGSNGSWPKVVSTLRQRSRSRATRARPPSPMSSQFSR
eukprot:15930-Eustigmatos_ZCMA.PRE.1